MARGIKPSGTGEWLQKLGEQLGAELGEIIAQSVQRTLAARIDVHQIARKLGAGGDGKTSGKARRGRPAAGSGSAEGKAGCAEPGCESPVLAKGLCRSHYYRARYEAQKGGKAAGRRPAK